MGADFIFRMGSTHAICQDYAIAGETAGHGYALLSDGCSGVKTPGQPGSPYTDFGARFLVRAAQLCIPRISREDSLPAEVIVGNAAAVVRQAELPSSALDATLLVAVTTEAGDVSAFQAGDGVVAARGRDGKISYRRIEYPSGMPLYLSYMLDRARLDALLKIDGTVSVTERTFDPALGWGEAKQWTEYALRPMAPARGFFGKSEFARDEVDVVLLMSDGVESFQTKDGATVPLEKILEQLFAFKGFQGEFLVRRCTRFLQKFCAENGWQHADDFSAAGIHMGSP